MTGLRTAIILASLAPLQLGAGPVRAQGLLGELLGSEMPQDYETGNSQSASKPQARNPRGERAQPSAARPAKPRKEARKTRALANAPLPPPRPWGAEDAPDEEGPREVAIEREQPAVQERRPEPSAAEAEEPKAVPVKANVGRAVVLIAKRELRANDLGGRKIATGLSGESPEHLRELVQRGAGLQVSPVNLSWSAGLEHLARGDVDGVTLSVGPRLTPEETQGLAMGQYQVLEIPLDPDTVSVERR